MIGKPVCSRNKDDSPPAAPALSMTFMRGWVHAGSGPTSSIAGRPLDRARRTACPSSAARVMVSRSSRCQRWPCRCE